MNASFVHCFRIGASSLTAVVINNRLEDVIAEPKPENGPVIESIFLARIDRRFRSTGGCFVTLPNKQVGYISHGRGLREGDLLPVQVTGYAEEGKPVPLTTTIKLKGRYVVLTPGKPGRNVSRSISDRKRRRHLSDLLASIPSETPGDVGMIARTGSGQASDRDIREETEALLQSLVAVNDATEGRETRKILTGPSSFAIAVREWADSGDIEFIRQETDDFRERVISFLDEFLSTQVDLACGGTMFLESTRSTSCVDVNTGSDHEPGAAARVARQSVAELPRHLRIRGMGGQVIIDFPGLDDHARERVFADMKRKFGRDPVNTRLIGWTRMGLFELVRKRERLPLTMVLGQ